MDSWSLQKASKSSIFPSIYFDRMWLHTNSQNTINLRNLQMTLELQNGSLCYFTCHYLHIMCFFNNILLNDLQWNVEIRNFLETISTS